MGQSHINQSINQGRKKYIDDHLPLEIGDGLFTLSIMDLWQHAHALALFSVIMQSLVTH